jgi:putative phosphoribosyl transferase
VAIRFRDRADAGRRLAAELATRDFLSPVVLALPRGGVPVAAAVAATLNAPLDVFVAGKIGAPGRPELGIGAVAEGSADLVVSDAGRHLGVATTQLAELAAPVREEVRRRAEKYRAGRSLPDITGRDVVLVDDGLATGVTAEAAINALRDRGPCRVILAVPVGAPASVRRLAAVADDVVCVVMPQGFAAVGEWYDRFDQTSDAEVVAALRGSA